VCGVDPGPWMFGELLSIAEGRQQANKGLASAVGQMLFGAPKVPEKRIVEPGPELDAMLALLESRLPKRG
jgi:hypothetical protein